MKEVKSMLLKVSKIFFWMVSSAMFCSAALIMPDIATKIAFGVASVICLGMGVYRIYTEMTTD